MDGRRPRRRPMVYGQALITAIGPTIADPDFAVPNVGTGSGAYQYNPAGAPWTYTALSPGPPPVGSGVTGNGSPFTSNNSDAPAGTQVAFVQGTGSISQSVVFPAGTYTVQILSAARQTGGPSGNDVDLKIDSTSVLYMNLTGTSSPGYNLFTSAPFTVTAGTHTVALVGRNTPGTDRTSFFSMIVFT